MSKMNDVQNLPAMTPSPLPAGLEERLLASMLAASADEGDADELERRLRMLRPASVGSERQQAWLSAMTAAAVVRHSYAGWSRLYRWSAAAALFVLCASGSMMMNGSASATVPSGLACRSVMETRTGDAVQWHEGQTALRSCDVLYEDSFVLDGEEDSTITVRVPVRSQVLIEEEVI